MKQPTPNQRIDALERQCRMLREQRDAARGEEHRLRAGIRDLWEAWMDDDRTWVEVAGVLDDLHTSLDLSAPVQ